MPRPVLTSWLRESRLFGRRLPTVGDTPQVPDGLRVYAVGDIHGSLGLFERLMYMIGEDIGRHCNGDVVPVIVFLGDYIDRGTDSRGVVERLIQGPIDGVDCRFLLGNHEASLLQFLQEPAKSADWLSFGGAETIASYGVRVSVGIREASRCAALRDRFRDALPDTHIAFLSGLETLVEFGDYAFVHAGIKPGRALARQRLQDLLWIREPFLSDHRRHERVVVHGHTVVESPEVRDNRIAIDTGAYASGVLTSLVLQKDQKCLLQARA